MFQDQGIPGYQVGWKEGKRAFQLSMKVQRTFQCERGLGSVVQGTREWKQPRSRLGLSRNAIVQGKMARPGRDGVERMPV